MLYLVNYAFFFFKNPSWVPLKVVVRLLYPAPALRVLLGIEVRN